MSDRRPVTIHGEAFLACGCTVLMTDRTQCVLEDQDLAGLVCGLLREAGVNDHTSSDAKVDVEIRAVEVVTQLHVPEGFNYLAHPERTVEYEVLGMFISKTFDGKKRSRIVGKDACRELAGLEQIRREF